MKKQFITYKERELSTISFNKEVFNTIVENNFYFMDIQITEDTIAFRLNNDWGGIKLLKAIGPHTHFTFRGDEFRKSVGGQGILALFKENNIPEGRLYVDYDEDTKTFTHKRDVIASDDNDRGIVIFGSQESPEPIKNDFDGDTLGVYIDNSKDVNPRQQVYIVGSGASSVSNMLSSVVNAQEIARDLDDTFGAEMSVIQGAKREPNRKERRRRARGKKQRSKRLKNKK